MNQHTVWTVNDVKKIPVDPFLTARLNGDIRPYCAEHKARVNRDIQPYCCAVHNARVNGDIQTYCVVHEAGVNGVIQPYFPVH